MKLFLMAYANVAILIPALWIGARLWLRSHYQTPAAASCAQIIAFLSRWWPQTECTRKPVA